MDPILAITVNRDSRRLTGMAAGMFFLTFLSPLAFASPAVPDTRAQMQANYGKLPLSFEANQGQTDAQVKFLARGQGYTLFLTPTEAVLNLKKPQAKTKDSLPSARASSSSTSKTIGAMLRMQLIGANSTPKVAGKEPLPGHVNYLIGKDPSRWRTQVPTYGKVAYEGVYPGVDLVYYGNQGQLEYDFVVAPGADPHNIKLSFKGADKIEVNSVGELILHTTNGDIKMHKPVIYQQIGGARKPIAGDYILKTSQMVGFQVATYDTAHPLIIDPVLVYSTYLGGSGNEDSSDIAVDLHGRAYVTGTTDSPDFPTENALRPTKSGDRDAFVVQLTADGRALRYSTYLGGSNVDAGHGIAVDLRGRAYVTGFTESPDFPTKNALQPNLKTGIVQGDAFVAQLTADGRALRYSTYLGGSSNDGGNGIAVDLQGQAYVTGFTDSPDFPTKNALQPAKSGDTDGFVAKLSTDGRALRYSTYLGAGNDDSGSDIAVDLWGRAYVAGFTQSPGFPTKNALQPTINSLAPGDAFVTQLSASGSTLGYSTYLGGSDSEIVVGITVDLRGQAYVIGGTHSPDFPTKNALQSALGGSEDAFVAKFSPTGVLRYSTYLGGRDGDQGGGIAVDRQGQAYVTGVTTSSDFPIVNPLQANVSGNGSVFVAKFSADGLTLRYSTYLGGEEGSIGVGIAVDRMGQAYVTGTTQSTDFPIINPLQPTLGGGLDAFVAKIRSDGQP